MERRQFLIGSGSILTASFISKATVFAEKTKSVLPLMEQSNAKQTIYFVNNGFDYQLLLNQSGFDYPPAITYREALDRYFGVFIPQDKPLNRSDTRELSFDPGLMPKQLDEEADFEFFGESWARTDSPNAEAYHLLDGLDLFDYSGDEGRLIGGLKFIDGPHPGSDYLGVHADDALSANLLQARLLELNTDIAVEIVGAA